MMRVTRRVIFTILPCMLVFCEGLPAADVASTLIVDSTFETNVFDKTWNISGNPPVLQDEIVRGGRYAMKSALDRNSSTVDYRTEARMITAPYPIDGRDLWYGFSMFLPTSFVPDSVWEVVFQWHNAWDSSLGELGSLNPVMAMLTTNGKWTLENRWDSKQITIAKQYEGTRIFALGNYKTNAWTDWVFHIKWSYKSDGLIQVWKDGVMVVNATGPNCFNDLVMPYFKAGIYKGWKGGLDGQVTSRVLYHDEFRVAMGPTASYDDVAPQQIVRPSPPVLQAIQ